MATWKKVLFVITLITFIGLSVFFTFYSIARDTFEFKEKTDIAGIEDLDGWVFYGFNGNAGTKEVHIDFVRDKNGNNPDESRPVVAVDDFTIVSDEYVEFLHIGKDVEYIDPAAFYYCKKLKAVYVDEENEHFCAVDGILYSKDMKRLILHPIRNAEWLVEQGKAETKDTFVVPEGVEEIGSYSFYKNVDLVHLTFSSTLKSIGDMAFFGCNNMWSIRLPEGLETIGADAFSYCWSMSPVMYIPASVKFVDHHAFFGCTALKVFYMGAESKEDIELGDAWLPKSVSKAVFYVHPKPEYGKTYEESLAEKERIDSQNS